MKRVAIVYHYFAHYRLPVLRELANSTIVDYVFIADTEPEDGIKTIDFYNDKQLSGKFLKVENMFYKKFIWQKGLIKILRENEFDAVVFLGEDRQLSTWFSLFMFKFMRGKTYLWSHGLYGREKFYRKWMRLLFIALANGAFLYNNRAKKLLEDAGFDEEKLHVIYNSLDFDNIEKVRGEFDTATKDKLRKSFDVPGAPTIYCISRINKSKRIDMLIEAIHQLKEKNFILNGFIIGDGPEVGNLKKMAEDYNLQGQIIFVGPLYDEKVISEHIMSSDLCVCPGAIGLTSIHSLSYGVPVVSNDNFPSQGPEFEAIEPGVTGAFFKDGDVNDMAAKIQHVLEQSAADKPLMMENCLKVVKEFYNPTYQRKVLNSVLTDTYA